MQFVSVRSDSREQASRLIFGLDIAGVEISSEILFAKVSNFVVTTFNPSSETIVNKDSQTTSDFLPTPVNILRDNCWRQDHVRRLQCFENPLIGGHLHPIAGTTHGESKPKASNTAIGILCDCQYTLSYISTPSESFYYNGLESDQVARVSRGSDCPLDPFGKCGLVVGHQIRGGSRICGTQAMYDDDTRGLEGPERPVESTTTNQQLLADGGTTWGNLTGFQRDCLEAIARLERDDETPYGLEIKRQLEDQHGEVNHGRLYPNLDDLVELGLVEKSELDKRTNEYALSRDGRGLLIQRVERMAAACELTTAVAKESTGDRE